MDMLHTYQSKQLSLLGVMIFTFSASHLTQRVFFNPLMWEYSNFLIFQLQSMQEANSWTSESSDYHRADCSSCRSCVAQVHNTTKHNVRFQKNVEYIPSTQERSRTDKEPHRHSLQSISHLLRTLHQIPHLLLGRILRQIPHLLLGRIMRQIPHLLLGWILYQMFVGQSEIQNIGRNTKRAMISSMTTTCSGFRTTT